MSKWRLGLSLRFGLVIALALSALLAIAMVMLQRQDAMQEEMADLAGKSMRSLVVQRMQADSEASIEQVADSLVNPLYYFDLDAIGSIARQVLRQPDIRYVLIYDRNGDIIHDGSGDIPTYGHAMSDPLAYDAVNAEERLTQRTDDVMDVSAPIRLGDQRLGGVRIGVSLKSAHENERHASQNLVQTLRGIGDRYRSWLFGLLLILMAMACLVGWALQRALVRPIRQLAGSAREIEAGNFAAQVPVTQRNDEIGDLLRAFGRMRESIARHDRDIRRMAYTDPLTGLANRLSFREQLDRKVVELSASGREMALLFVDIDNFKRINDSLGHDAGDEVLVHFASRMQRAAERIGGRESILARFGGDEFVLLLIADARRFVDIRETADEVAKSLVDDLAGPIRVHERQLFLGASIGITLFPQDAREPATLMKHGDIAMYQAKMEGKNCYRFFNRAMDEAVAVRMRMENDLRGAWDRGELTLEYQPVYRLSDRSLVGAEALLRWRHQEGTIPPATFIDVAEQSGLIERIGPEVLRTACRDAAAWNSTAREPLFVSVNVSPRQLRSADLPAQVLGALADAELEPAALHLELTETALIADEVKASTMLASLRSQGVRIWLDDFGTGFSGLSHLRRVPVDGVKIDKSFVSDLTRDPDDLALTTAVIAMAHSLGITVVAEGIEDEEQYQVLRHRRCDLGQGYWFGRPVAASDFQRLLD